MKIRKISLENLNSLVGEHQLDLTAEPIASAGIFAITGPTGAGKSTLLDAITLALYGRAARYDRPNPEDMMSRHEGKCRAEVEFEVNGETYRAEWTRHRAREKAEGKMQAAKRFVYDADGAVLTQGLAEADKKIEEICGLSYERFMRSALLAQGEFARFLKSKEDERAELLESLTGTEVFSELSKLVFAETSERSRELDEREKLLGAIVPLEEAVRTEKIEALEENSARLKADRAKLKSLGESLVRADELSKMVASMAATQKSLGLLKAERAAAKVGLDRLARHRKAEKFFPALAKVDDAEATVSGLGEQVGKANLLRDGERARLEVGLASAAALVRGWIGERERILERLRVEARRAGEDRSSLESWFKSHRADVSLREALPDLSSKIEALRIQRGHWKQAHEKIVALKKDQKSGLEKREALGKKLAEVKGALAGLMKQQEAANEKLAAIGGEKDSSVRQVELERLANLIKLQAKAAMGEKVVGELQHQVIKIREQQQQVVEKHRAAAELLESHQAHLQTETLRAGLEDHRADLRPGEPCPLCGSLEHPSAEGGDGESKIAELKSKVGAAKEAVSILQKEERSGAKKLVETEAKIEAGDKERAAMLAELERGYASVGLTAAETADLEPLLEKRRAELGQLESAKKAAEKLDREVEMARQSIEKYEIEQRGGSEVLEKLERQLAIEQDPLSKALRAGERAQDELEAALGPFGELVPAAGMESGLRESLEARAKAYGEKETALAKAVEGMKSMGAKETEITAEVSRLRERLHGFDVAEGAQAEDWKMDSIAAMDKRLLELDSASTSARAAASERDKQMAAAKSELAERETSLLEMLEGADEFPDIDALRRVRLEAEELAELASVEKRLSDEEKGLRGKMEGSEENLQRLRKMKLPEGEGLDEMRVEHQQLQEMVDGLGDQTSVLRTELKTDETNRERLKEKGAALAADRDKLKVWQRLSGLIGAADGKKFRRFAQGLSLDVLLRHANQHLERLSERYQLARVEGEELGLEIVDLFQASVTRPMSSLSGGESFLASLALALGLSDLAGRNVQIDSLFIDEGFGSLDADSLDEAIAALESLRLREKTVGVISHVELLKERISTQVVVGRDAAGRGRLEVVG